MNDILKNLPKNLLADVRAMMEGVTKPALDPVNKQTKDVDNDGDVDNSDKFLTGRRKVIAAAMKKEENDADLEGDFVVEDLTVLEEGAGVLKNLSKPLKKVVTNAGGGEFSDHSEEKATGALHFKSLVHNGLKKGHTVVVHHDGKPVAAIRHSGENYDSFTHHVYNGDERQEAQRSEKRHGTGKFDRHANRFIPTEYRKYTQPGHKVSEAKDKLNHIVSTHLGSHVTDKDTFKNNHVTVSTYGRDKNRHFVRLLKANIKKKSDANPELDKAVNKMADKHLGHVKSPLDTAKEMHAKIADHLENGDRRRAHNLTRDLADHILKHGADKEAYTSSTYKKGLKALKSAYKGGGDSWRKDSARRDIKHGLGEEVINDLYEAPEIDESYTDLTTLKQRIVMNKKKLNALHSKDPAPSADKKALAIRIQKDTRKHSDIFHGQFQEETEIDEARGRPKRAVVNQGFTMHPKTKEKLMHNNPVHQAKIELLQKNGILPIQHIEASQHIMQQLQKAKLSMAGGGKVNFNDGKTEMVHGRHAARLIDKYADMKPHEKEAFQKKIQQSHAHMMGEIN